MPKPFRPPIRPRPTRTTPNDLAILSFGLGRGASRRMALLQRSGLNGKGNVCLADNWWVQSVVIVFCLFVIQTAAIDSALAAPQRPSFSQSGQYAYPYPTAQASGNSPTNQPTGGWSPPRTAQANQPMSVPFSGQSFASPSINQPQSGFPSPAISGSPSATFGDTFSSVLTQAPLTQAPQTAPPPPPAILQSPNASQNPVFTQNVQPVFQPQVNGLDGPTPLDLDVYVPQGPTGRIMVGGTYSSDSDVIGELIIDERDFDITGFPRSFGELFGPRAFRGGGQTLRAEIVPGTDLERYVINFADPYFLSSDYSLSLSGYYFDRQYFDWDEQRAGGRISIGRNLTNYLSINAGLRLEQVEIDNLRLGTSPQLNASLGDNDLYMFNVGLVYDTRQSPFLLDTGSYLSLNYKQAFGDFSFARGEIDYRVQRLLFKRTPTSGHHTLSFRTQLGFSGSSTPVFENYIAGGYSSMRGFDFRGVGPVENGVRVGGEFQWLNSLEYQFPITQDDMISAVTFIDFGTVEESVELNSENFRVAPGIGLRVNLPFAGMSAPLAFDFAFPVSDAAGDDQRTFSFVVGLVR